MLKEFIQYIINLSKPDTLKVNDYEYSKQQLMLVTPPYAQSLEVKSLTSLVEYCSNNADELELKSTIVSIPDFNEVEVISCLDDFSRRENYIVAHCAFEPFKFGAYYLNENFVINLQSLFKPNPDLAKLQQIASTITDVNQTKIEDNGVTQNVTAQTGLAKLEKQDLPNPVKLQPYRTFSEIEPVESEFVFRVRKNQQGMIECALFEADGGKWKEDTIARIREFLITKLNKKLVVL